MTKHLFKTCAGAIAFLMLTMLPSKKASASHAAGADLTYSYVNDSTYFVTASFYRDCSGIDAPTSVQIELNSLNCQYSSSTTLNADQGTGNEITFPCLTQTTVCSSGNQPGIQQYVYSGNVQVPMHCNDWKLSYAVLARNCAITTIVQPVPCNSNTTNDAIYVEALLNNLDVAVNSSPSFTNVPVTFVCMNQDFTYNHGVTDADGDQLVYSLITPKTSATSTISFVSPYSATNPITSSPAFGINSSNGDIFMHPTQIEVGIVAVLVQEYRNGILIGSVIRDMQIYTRQCNNDLPEATGIDGTNLFSATVCAGGNICFDVFSSDNDAAQIVSMNWNGGINGASFSVNQSNRPVGHFCWSPALSDARQQPYTFTVTVRDNACPYNGVQTYSFSITVPLITPMLTVTDETCSGNDGAVAVMMIDGGEAPFSYSWLPNGETSSSINNLSHGSYQVTVTDANGCSGFANALVNLTGALNITPLVTDASCGLADGEISVMVSGGVMPYSYLWSTGSTASSISNLAPGPYSVFVSDGNGCEGTAYMNVVGSGMNLSISQLTNATCLESANGSATVEASGGSMPYFYQWSPVGGLMASAENLAPGVYQVLVQDYFGCSSTIDVTIGYDHSSPIVSLGPDDLICEGDATMLDAGSGFAGYLWNDLSTNQNLLVMVSGNYSVTVTDNYGCQGSDDINVDFAICTGIKNVNGGLTAKAFPNPAGDHFEIQVSHVNAGDIRIYNSYGAVVFTNENEVVEKINIDCSSWSNGIYMIQLKQGNETTNMKITRN